MIKFMFLQITKVDQKGDQKSDPIISKRGGDEIDQKGDLKTAKKRKSFQKKRGGRKITKIDVLAQKQGFSKKAPLKPAGKNHFSPTTRSFFGHFWTLFGHFLVTFFGPFFDLTFGHFWSLFGHLFWSIFDRFRVIIFDEKMMGL